MRWLQIGGSLLLIFLGALFKSELEIIDKVDPIEMMGAIPIARSSILYGLIVCCIAAFTVLNWSVIRHVFGAYRRFKIRRSNKKWREKNGIVEGMIKLKQWLAYNPNLPFDSLCRPPGVSSFITIHVRELRRLGLVPLENSNPPQWIFHLERLVPFVQAYGVESAKKEMETWYSNEGGG